MSSIYKFMTNCCVISTKLTKLYRERPVLTSEFKVSKLQKQLRRVMQIHLVQSANFGPLPLNVCMTVSHSINC